MVKRNFRKTDAVNGLRRVTDELLSQVPHIDILKGMDRVRLIRNFINSKPIVLKNFMEILYSKNDLVDGPDQKSPTCSAENRREPAFSTAPSVGVNPLDALMSGWIQSGTFGTTIQKNMLIDVLLSQVIDGRSPSEVLDDAWKFARSCSAGVERYFALTGVEVETPLSFSRDVKLIPWSDVRDSEPKNIFGAPETFDRVVYAMHLPRLYGSAAIKIIYRDQQVLFQNQPETMFEMAKNERANLSAISDIPRCISLVSMQSAVIFGGWSNFDNPFANEFVGSAYGLQTFPPESSNQFMFGKKYIAKSPSGDFM